MRRSPLLTKHVPNQINPDAQVTTRNSLLDLTLKNTTALTDVATKSHRRRDAVPTTTNRSARSLDTGKHQGLPTSVGTAAASQEAGNDAACNIGTLDRKLGNAADVRRSASIKCRRSMVATVTECGGLETQQYATQLLEKRRTSQTLRPDCQTDCVRHGQNGRNAGTPT